MSTIRFAGLRFTPFTVEQSVQIIAGRASKSPFDYVVTPNAEHAYLRRHDQEFRQCGEECLISTNDSRILRLIARLAGLELHFAPGAYIVDRLFETAIKPDDPITILGCTTEVVASLKQQFKLTHVAHHNPPMGFIHDEAAIAAAVAFTASHPGRYIFVAMGPPQSEKLCHRIIRDGRATGIGLCIGSSLNMITGHANRAPDWMEQNGLVWLYRLVKEPRRLWRRYLVRAMYGLGLGCVDILRYRLGLAAKGGS